MREIEIQITRLWKKPSIKVITSVLKKWSFIVLPLFCVIIDMDKAPIYKSRKNIRGILIKNPDIRAITNFFFFRIVRKNLVDEDAV